MSKKSGKGFCIAGMIAGAAALALGGKWLYDANKKSDEEEDYPELNNWYTNTGDEDEE